MLITFLITSGLLLGILITTVLHLPLWLKRLIYYVPAWIQAAVIHFAYGAWVGGVLGHVVGGFISIPWFFVVVVILKPRIRREMADAWATNPLRTTLVRVYRRASTPPTMLVA